MYRIIEGRGTGKTSRLMLLAKENDAIFVCSNPDAMKYKASKNLNYKESKEWVACAKIINNLDGRLVF